MSNYTIDELTAIFTGLKAFDSVSHRPSAAGLANKFGGNVVALADNMMIDLSSTVMEDGRLFTKWGFTDSERAIGWFLGFGDKVQVTGPPEMVEKMKIAIDEHKCYCVCRCSADHRIATDFSSQENM